MLLVQGRMIWEETLFLKSQLVNHTGRMIARILDCIQLREIRRASWQGRRVSAEEHWNISLYKAVQCNCSPLMVVCI